MADIKIKQITDQEEIFDVFHWFPGYSFGPTPPLPNKEEKIEQIKQKLGVKYFALYEDGKAVSTVASLPMTQNIRGKLFSADGIFDVATHPEFRRKGYSKKVMKELLQVENDSGIIFSTLYPFKESFYEKLGYVSFPEPLQYLFKTSTLLPLLKKTIPGEVTMTTLEEGFDEYIKFVKRIQAIHHGMAFFDHHPIERIIKRPSWLLTAKMDGEVVAMMTYKIMGDEVTKLKFRSMRFFYTKPEGRILLLEWIARHVDQTSDVEILVPPYEQINLWLSDLSVEIKKFWLAPMGRVLNLPEISGMHVGSGEFTAKITDPLCPWNEGIWKFESDNGLLNLSPSKSPEFDLSIQGLSALINGTHSPDNFEIRAWGNPTEKSQKAMLSLFPPKTPFLYEYF
jgi:predicted acetyltransferase